VVLRKCTYPACTISAGAASTPAPPGLAEYPATLTLQP